MFLNNSIKIKNYKCFGEEAQGFEKIHQINVIIGKNNAGKSSLIDLISYLTKRDDNFLKSGRNGDHCSVYISNILDEELKCFERSTSGGDIPTSQFHNHYLYGQTFKGTKIEYELTSGNKKNIFRWQKPMTYGEGAYKFKIENNIKVPLAGKKFKQINAERDITLELDNPYVSPITDNLRPNGNGATWMIQHIVNRTQYDSRLIEEKLLRELNEIINPDIEFEKIFTQVNEDNYWEIYFEDKNSKRVALSKMGSGIKTILLVLLNLVIVPQIENTSPQQYVFAFEELENNIHPSLLRRLFSYIKKYAEVSGAYFFITTHSNIVIDLFSDYDHAQIIHVTNDGKESVCTTVSEFLDNKRILRDLDVRASDILQANGIIWVEGPSDRNFLIKWLSLISDFEEGYHFSIMFYGGRLLANLSFDYATLNAVLIPMLKINHNAFVIIDRDGKSINSALNQTKKRIQGEIGEKNCWITKGREIENYLSDRTLACWLKDEVGKDFVVTNSIYEKIENTINEKTSKIKYEKKKAEWSARICKNITTEDLRVLDLLDRLTDLKDAISHWNQH